MTTRKHVFYGILALVSLLGLGITQSARATYIVTLQEVGSSVVATGNGTFDLTALHLTDSGIGGFNPGMIPTTGILLVGSSALADRYDRGISGPASFGSGGGIGASLASGDIAAIFGSSSVLFVPTGYPLTGGNLLSGTSTFNNKTFASLGVTPGTYVWTWGTGVHADSFTIQIGPAAVPDAGSTLSLLSFALLGLVALRRKLRC